MKVLALAVGAAGLYASSMVKIEVEPDEHLVFFNNCTFFEDSGQAAKDADYFACALSDMTPYVHAGCLWKSIRIGLRAQE